MYTFDWENYKKLLEYYFRDHYQQYEKNMNVEDRDGFRLLERQTEHLCELIIDEWGIDTSEYKVKPHLKQGGISSTPWIEINRAHGSNANGENSYYVAFIYSPKNDAVLLNVTTSSTYLNKLGKSASEIEAINQKLKEKIEEQYSDISFDNVNDIHKSVGYSKNENDIKNLYLLSSVFYVYTRFDLGNINYLRTKAYELYGIWDATNEDIKLTDFYSSENLDNYNIKKSAEHRIKQEALKEPGSEPKIIKYLESEMSASGKPRKEASREEIKASKISRAKAARIRERQTKLGDMAEDLIVEQEKKHLEAIGRKDLADKVYKLPTDGDGYDVESFYDDGSQKKIEVKSNSSNSYDFYVSDNELNHLLNEAIEVYFVKNPSKEDAEVIRVKMDPDKSNYTPVSYIATAKK